MKLDSSNAQIKEELKQVMIKKYETEHQLMALFAVFSVKNVRLLINEEQIKLLQALIKSFKEGKNNIGIIDQLLKYIDKPVFIHRTFAEYLIVIYFINSLQNMQLIEKIKKITIFLIDQI